MLLVRENDCICCVKNYFVVIYELGMGLFIENELGVKKRHVHYFKVENMCQMLRTYNNYFENGRMRISYSERGKRHVR